MSAIAGTLGTFAKIEIANAVFSREYLFDWIPALSGNRKDAQNVIALCDMIGFMPEVLYDVGANESQWARHIVRRWPKVRVVSFEPNESCRPFGKTKRDMAKGHFLYPVALSSRPGAGRMDCQGASVGGEVRRVEMGPVPIWRFAGLGEKVPSNAMLKIDCESGTYDALIGFADDIHKFTVVVVEVWLDSFVNICAWMRDAGFDRAFSSSVAVSRRRPSHGNVVFWKDGK